MSTQFTLGRRQLLLGTGAASLAALLSACGSGQPQGTSAATATLDASQLAAQINPQDRSSLQQGGELNLPVGNLGPVFNTSNQNGNTADTGLVMSTMATNLASGLWASTSEGKTSINPDFCESYEAQTVDGVQTIRIKLNPKAKFNDGRAIDIESLRATWTALRGTTEDYQIVSSGAYGFIESIEEDGDAFSAVVTMSRPYYPSYLFGTLMHPDMADPAVFNEGFVDNPRPELLAGPFKLEEYSSAEKRLSVVPNENWWGEKPLLDRINFRQLEASAARAAFRNGEIDAVGASTLAAYKDVESVEDAEPRRSIRIFSGGLDLNPGRVQDAALRRAIFAATDRSALSQIRFQGLNWNEQVPGSMVLLPVSPYYRDNFPAAQGPEAAAKILEESGYSKQGDYYAKGEAKAKFEIMIFGDDPVSIALAQALIEQMKAAGIECNLDQQPDANFGTILQTGEYDMTFAGFSVGDDATTGARQFYHSDNQVAEGVGSAEIDALIEEMELIEDDAERNAKCNEIEQKFMAEFATLGTVFNGPDIRFCRKKLANYGTFVFGAPNANPAVWTSVGWMK